MKKRLLDFWKLIKEILTLLIGGSVFISFSIVGLLYSFIKHIFIKRDYSASKQLAPIVRSITLATDGLACASAGELLNDAFKLKKDSAVKFGKWYHTISAVTGMLMKLGRDSKFRRVLDIVLGKKHCEEAITPEQISHYLRGQAKRV